VIRRRAAAALALSGFTVAGAARAQLVPITRCNAAIPCSIPIGLRPADAAAWTPGAKTGQGNTGISVSMDERLKPKVDKPPSPISEDPTDRAARIFMKRNPLAVTPKPTPKPTPTAKPS
jgi:hypothetical protein